MSKHDGLIERIARVEAALKMPLYGTLIKDDVRAIIAAIRELEAALEALVNAIEAPRYGDDSLWDDIHGFDDPGPLDRARLALGREDQSNG